MTAEDISSFTRMYKSLLKAGIPVTHDNFGSMPGTKMEAFITWGLGHPDGDQNVWYDTNCNKERTYDFVQKSLFMATSHLALGAAVDEGVDEKMCEFVDKWLDTHNAGPDGKHFTDDAEAREEFAFQIATRTMSLVATGNPEYEPLKMFRAYGKEESKIKSELVELWKDFV